MSHLLFLQQFSVDGFSMLFYFVSQTKFVRMYMCACARAHTLTHSFICAMLSGHLSLWKLGCGNIDNYNIGPVFYTRCVHTHDLFSTFTSLSPLLSPSSSRQAGCLKMLRPPREQDQRPTSVSAG